MLSVKSAQVDFMDVRVRRLRGNLEEMQSRVQLASSTISELLQDPENQYMTLEQVAALESIGSILQELGLL